MKIKKNFHFNGEIVSGTIEEPSTCPMCKHAVKPQELFITPYENDHNQWYISALYLCKHCYQTFVTLSGCSLFAKGPGYKSSFSTKLVYTEPNRFSKEHFDTKIEELSTQFIKIYNQALAAESYGLDEIAGIGYRKAVEFLVKDFCIHLKPDEEDKIKSLLLAKCIINYVDNPQIQTLATRAAWIGNDEAHYIRKQEKRDISDMKNFIKAMVYFIGMVLITEDAASISPA